MDFYSNDNKLCILPSDFKSILLNELKDEYKKIPKITQFNKEEFDIFLEHWNNIPSVEIYNIVATVSSYLIIENEISSTQYKPYHYISWNLVRDNLDKFNNCYIIPKYYTQKTFCLSSEGDYDEFSEAIVKDDNIEWLKNHVKFLKKNSKLETWSSYYYWESSSILGNLNFMKWLHENNLNKYIKVKVYRMGAVRHVDKYSCSVNLMNNAAVNGHFEMVKWLHENRNEGCTTRAIDGAAAHGHFQIVEWLKENKNIDCTVNAMNWAAQEGNLNAIKWLHEKGYDCSADAINYAAKNGNLEIVKWLEKN